MGQVASYVTAIATGARADCPTLTCVNADADDYVAKLASEESSDDTTGSSGSESSDDAEPAVFSVEQIAAAEANSAREYAVMGNLTTDAATALAVNESRFEAEVMGGLNEEEALAEALRRSMSTAEDVAADDLVSDSASSEASGLDSDDEWRLSASDPRLQQPVQRIYPREVKFVVGDEAWATYSS